MYPISAKAAVIRRVACPAGITTTSVCPSRTLIVAAGSNVAAAAVASPDDSAETSAVNRAWTASMPLLPAVLDGFAHHRAAGPSSGYLAASSPRTHNLVRPRCGVVGQQIGR